MSNMLGFLVGLLMVILIGCAIVLFVLMLREATNPCAGYNDVVRVVCETGQR